MDGFDCFDEYILTYNQNGSIRNVQLLSIFNDTLLHIESLTKKNTRCSSKIKESLERLSLNYINPYSDFRIIIKLYYQNTLEIWECFQYQGKLSNDDNWNSH